MATKEDLMVLISLKGEEIRTLKAQKDSDEASKEVLQNAISDLLALKTQYQTIVGEPYDPPKKVKTKKAEGIKKEGDKEEKKSKKQLNKERKKAQKQEYQANKTTNQDESKVDISIINEQKKEIQKKEQHTKNNHAIGFSMESIIKDILPLDEQILGMVIFSKHGDHLPFVTMMLCNLLQQTKSSNVQFLAVDTSTSFLPTLVISDNQACISGDLAIARYICRLNNGPYNLYDPTPYVAAQIDMYVDYALTYFHGNNTMENPLCMLNTTLQAKTYLVGYALTLADLAVYGAFLTMLKTNANLMEKYSHISRWYQFIGQQDIFQSIKNDIANVGTYKPKVIANKGNTSVKPKTKSLGSCPPLEGAQVGQVVTRFPPEPSGYLHIGHVKACMLNDYYAKHYEGKLIVRFDDTNPSKEKDEFTQSILADLKRLEITPHIVTHTSDHFDLLYEKAIQLIEQGDGYMDNTPQEQMRAERMDGIESKCRNQDIATNLAIFQQMCGKYKSKDAKEIVPDIDSYCLRGKIDMQAKNKTLRDPVFYRVNTAVPHLRTGTKYRAYPTYDFACPIIDSIEGVTHALRTTEYNDRDAQYQWVLETLKLRPVVIHGFARMNFIHTVLSKRKLQWFVNEQLVDGWNDPRFPTVQGVLRRGVQVEALREFILSQGASRRMTDMEWDKFWAINKKVLDPTAPRYYALDKENAVPLVLTNISENLIGLPIARHPKDASLGNKIMRFKNKLLVEKDDVNQFVVGEEVTLMRHGNIIIKKLHYSENGDDIIGVEAEDNPSGDFKKTKLKITWLADVNDLVECTLVEFDHLLSKPKLEEDDSFQDYLTEVTRAEMKAIGDHELRTLKTNDVIQLERRGYFRVDRPYISKKKPLILFMVPDGKSKAMSTLSKNLAHR